MVADKKTLSQKEIEMFNYLKENPVLAANKLLVRNGRPMELTWYQRRIIKDLWKGKPYTLLIMGRGTGKTFTLAVFLILKALFYPRERLGIIGPTYRQSQFVFDEIVRIYEESEYLQASCKKPPSKLPTQCELKFNNGSEIIALPLGNDGNKVRGARFYRLVVDEAAQVPKDIIELVITPFLNTSKDPMSKDKNKKDDNQLIFASSAYYQFNHLYEMYTKYNKLIEEGNPDYSVHRYTYLDAPPGFISLKNIEHQKATFPKVKFLMENLCIFPADSEGFFPASLLRSVESRHALVEAKGVPGAEYVLGIDPAIQSDNFAIVVMKLGATNARVVNVKAFNRQNYPEMSFPKMADEIRKILRDYNVVRIAMDAGGGGTTIRDLLAEEVAMFNPNTGHIESFEPVLTIDADARYRRGRRIIDLVNFSVKEINNMNYDLKSDLENKRILIPTPPLDNTDTLSISDQDRIYMEIRQMVNEVENIVTTPLNSGYLHFSTPNDSLKKDRYSAFLLAAKAARDFVRGETTAEAKKLPTGRWVNGGLLLGR